MDEKYRVDIPEGASGDWCVQRFTVTPEDESFERIRACNPSTRGRFTPAGTYTRLTHRGSVVMSDTPDEARDHWQPIWRAKGRVLINGLGLGVVLQACLAKDTVEHVTVVEKSPDVIGLVAPHYLTRFGSKRLEIIQADALFYQPKRGTRFDVVWHDIWSNFSADNLPDMARLHRKYGKRCDWQGSWARELCRMYA